MSRVSNLENMKPSRKHSSCVKRDTENVDRDTQTPGSQPEDDGLEAMRIGPDVRPFDLADRKVLGVQGREMGAMKPHALALMHGKTSVNNGDSKATHIGPDVRPFNLTDRKVLRVRPDGSLWKSKAQFPKASSQLKGGEKRGRESRTQSTKP